MPRDLNNAPSPTVKLRVIDGGLSATPPAAPKVILDNPDRITVQEADLNRLRRPVRKWSVMCDGARTKYHIVQYADDRCCLVDGTRVVAGYDTLDGVQLSAAALLGALS